jgi:hypothetical protein
MHHSGRLIQLCASIQHYAIDSILRRFYAGYLLKKL